ncbi:MAG: hypothetical protein HC850_08585 [Rhodomicrobium sp.]|nr:hypothetical protein [Rhodomicrobium sp.]
MDWRKYIRPRRILIRADGTTALAPQEAVGPKVYVLSRALCAYTRVRLASPSRKARAAARLQAAYKQTFRDVRTRLADTGADDEHVGVWSWSGDFAIDTGETLAELRVLPESICRKGLTEGARLVRCIDGVEGEVWRDGALAASRWWPSEPPARDWLLFLRAAKADIDDQAVPTAESPQDRHDLPLIDLEPDNIRRTFSPARVATAAGAAFVFALSFEGARFAINARAAEAITAQIEHAVNENQSAYQQRRAAFAASAQVSALSNYGDPTVVARAALAVAQALPPNDARIEGFRVFDRALQARVAAKGEVDVPSLVATLENSEYLSEVFIERQAGGALVIRAVIPPPIAPVTARGT